MVQKAFKQLLFVSLSVFVLLAGIASARDVKLAWDAKAPDEQVSGYKIHHGPQSGIYDVVVDVGNVVEATILSLDDYSCYYFAATAYRNAGTYDGEEREYAESDYSDEAVDCEDVPTTTTTTTTSTTTTSTTTTTTTTTIPPEPLSPATGLSVVTICVAGGEPIEVFVGELPIEFERGEDESPKALSFYLTEIPSTLSVMLTAYDADFVDEGELDINGKGQIALFPDNSPDYDSIIIALQPIQVDTDWLVVGVNTLTFRWVSTGGYAIHEIKLTYYKEVP